MNPAGPIPVPDLRALLNAHAAEVMTAINCHEVGQIASFDAEKQTASVSVAMKRVVYNQRQTAGEGLQQTPALVDYPLLVDVPVFVPSGGTGYLNLPVKVGDPCLVLFNDRDLDAWFATGAALAPNSPRLHSLSDGMAIVGFRPLNASISDYATDRIALRNAGAELAALDDGTIEISANAGTLDIDAAGKLKLAGAGNSLKTAMDALLDALTGWVNTGGSTPNPATVAALTAVKTQLDAILS